MQNERTLPAKKATETLDRNAKAQENLLAWWAVAVYLSENDPVIRRELLQWEDTHLDGGTVGTSDWPGWARTPLGPCPR